MNRAEITAPIQAALDTYNLKLEQLPLGSVLCIVRLVEGVPTVRIVELAQTDPRIRQHEIHFGNYQPDRYAWKLEMVKVAPEPLPVKGAQGLWTWQY